MYTGKHMFWFADIQAAGWSPVLHK